MATLYEQKWWWWWDGMWKSAAQGCVNEGLPLGPSYQREAFLTAVLTFSAEDVHLDCVPAVFHPLFWTRHRASLYNFARRRRRLLGGEFIQVWHD